MVNDLAEDFTLEKAMQESAKEKRDDGQYNTHDQSTAVKCQIENYKAEIKELSEEYTRYQMLSQGLGFALSSAHNTSDSHTDTRSNSDPL